MSPPLRALSLALGLGATLASGGAYAQQDVTPRPMQDVAVVENLGAKIPLDLEFTDSNGKRAKLASYFRPDRPVVLTLAYYRCPMLCDLVLSGTARALREAQLSLGEDYQALTVSIDPTETPAQALEAQRGYVQAVGLGADRPEGWAFMTGEQENIRALAESLGFKYTKDEDSNQFAHAAVVFILSPEGTITRYLYGVQFSPKDLRLSMVEAAQGRVGTTLDKVLLTCYRFDPATRKYGLYITGFLRVGGLLVFFGLAGLIGTLLRRELRRKAIS